MIRKLLQYASIVGWLFVLHGHHMYKLAGYVCTASAAGFLTLFFITGIAEALLGTVICLGGSLFFNWAFKEIEGG